jgi:hypothetical protein
MALPEYIPDLQARLPDKRIQINRYPVVLHLVQAEISRQGRLQRSPIRERNAENHLDVGSKGDRLENLTRHIRKVLNIRLAVAEMRRAGIGSCRCNHCPDRKAHPQP